MIIATTNDLPGYRVVRVIGLVRGITVRSRSIIGNFGGALQSLVGGNLSIFTNLAEQARQEAHEVVHLGHGLAGLQLRHIQEAARPRARQQPGAHRLHGRRVFAAQARETASCTVS